MARNTPHLKKKRQNGSAQQQAVERNHANVRSGRANAKTEQGHHQRIQNNQRVRENGEWRSQRQTVPTRSIGSRCDSRSTQRASSMPSHAHGSCRWSTCQGPGPDTTASPRCGSQTIASGAIARHESDLHVGAARTTQAAVLKKHVGVAAGGEQEAPAN